jgi:hypothetical protein
LSWKLEVQQPKPGRGRLRNQGAHVGLILLAVVVESRLAVKAMGPSAWPFVGELSEVNRYPVMEFKTSPVKRSGRPSLDWWMGRLEVFEE